MKADGWLSFVGRLHYRENSVVVQVDEILSDYYRRMIPRYFDIQKQMHDAHITVIRSFETPDPGKKERLWGVLQDCNVWFEYNHCVMEDDNYYWLDVICPLIGDIRRAFGLPRFRRGRMCYHLTLGNRKHANRRTED